jgi:hypothetical protein
VDADAAENRPVRLGIIHLLGWMLGCAFVLAVLRAMGEFQEIPEKFVFRVRLSQMGFGLAYGTGLSGLGLFLWRWRTGRGQGPTQPGHWLLLMGGLAPIIDLATAGAAQWAVRILNSSIQPTDWRIHFWHQAIGWSIGLVILSPALLRLGGASRLWTLVAAALAAMIAISAAANIFSLIALAQGARGTWLWYVPEYANLLVPAIVVPCIAIAEAADRMRGANRDWLHLGGVAAAISLGGVSFVAHLPAFWL